MALLKKLKELHPESNADKKINNNAISTEQKRKLHKINILIMRK